MNLQNEDLEHKPEITIGAREVIVIIISLVFLIAYLIGWAEKLEPVLYFATFRGYFRTLLLGLVILIVFLLVPQFRKYSAIFLFLQVFMLGYLGVEVIYRLYYWKLSIIFRESPYILSLYHLDYFFIHRLYQVVPLLCMVFLFFSYPGGTFTNYFRFGNWNNPTGLIGKHRATWKKITLFFLWVLFIVLALFALLALFFPANLPGLKIHDVSHWWLIFFPSFKPW